MFNNISSKIVLFMWYRRKIMYNRTSHRSPYGACT